MLSNGIPLHYGAALLDPEGNVNEDANVKSFYLGNVVEQHSVHLEQAYFFATFFTGENRHNESHAEDSFNRHSVARHQLDLFFGLPFYAQFGALTIPTAGIIPGSPKVEIPVVLTGSDNECSFTGSSESTYCTFSYSGFSAVRPSIVKARVSVV